MFMCASEIEKVRGQGFERMYSRVWKETGNPMALEIYQLD